MREKKLESALAFVLILLIIAWATKSWKMLPVIIVVGFILGAIPWVLNQFYFVWDRLLKSIHFVVSNLLLSLIFILLVTPLSLVVRRSKKRTLVTDNRNKTSLFVDRKHTYGAKDLEEPW
jgi:predicted ferric reductase